MNRTTRKAIPHLAAAAAVATLAGCNPEAAALLPENLFFAAPAAFKPTCEVLSCSLPTGPGCTVARTEPGSFSVPNRSTIVFRSEIPAGARLPAPYTFVWRLDSGGPTARPPAGNDRESRVQHVYDIAGVKRVGVTITDGRGVVSENTSACEVTVSAGTTPAAVR